MSFPAGFPQADGSVIYENIRKIDVYVKGQPMYEDERAEWDMHRFEHPVQVRVWWEDYVPAMLGENAGSGTTSPEELRQMLYEAWAKGRHAGQIGIDANPYEASESSIVNEVADLSENQT